MDHAKIRPPQGWSNDQLTAFFDQVRNNQRATFDKKPEAKRLIQIDGCLHRIFESWRDPSPWFPVLLLQRAHACLRSAYSCAFSGQLYESFLVLRGAMEVSAYGVHVLHEGERAAVWLKREDSNADDNAMRKEFQLTRLKKSIGKLDPHLQQVFETLYEQTIEFGAHPNVHGVLAGIDIQKTRMEQEINSTYLHGDGPQLDHALTTAGRVGVWLLLALRAAYPDRIKDGGMWERIDQLKSGL